MLCYPVSGSVDKVTCDSIVMEFLSHSLLLLLPLILTSEVLGLSRTQKQLEFSIEDVTKVVRNNDAMIV